MEYLPLIAGIAGLIALAVWASNLRTERQRLLDEKTAWSKKLETERKAIEDDREAVRTLAKEKSIGFPWLAQAYADYFELRDKKVAEYLQWKPHPARKAAEHVREQAAKRRQAERLWRVLKYQLEYYESLFPWLIDFKGEDLDDLIRQIVERGTEEAAVEEDADPVSQWVTKAEYEKLTATERNQLALNRYWQKKKTSWELGRDYERYIGYLYESKGWKVHYQGIIEGLADLGRDLIAEKDGTVEIAQCKYWSKDKLIHEKHIFQLYGTLVAYRIDNLHANAVGVFTTSTVLSDRAKQFANALGIRFQEGSALQHYPCIKCNVSRKDGAKIYHLPFDQQYDRTAVEEMRLERYVETVAEAEALGFRRAFRWRGPATS